MVTLPVFTFDVLTVSSFINVMVSKVTERCNNSFASSVFRNVELKYM